MLEALAKDIDGFFFAQDLTEEGACSKIVEAAVKSLGGITTLVNCAGVLKGGALGAPQTNLDNFLYNMKGNCQSVFEMMEHAIPHLKTAGSASGPSIINVSSVNGKHSFAGCASYCASKVS